MEILNIIKERILNKGLEIKEEINKKFEKIKAITKTEKYELWKILENWG